MDRTRLRIAMYSHDAMGLGHMRRNLLVAQALRARLGATVLMISGAWEAGLFELPDGVDCITLPALRKDLCGRYESRRLDVPTSQLLRVRSGAIRAALHEFDPDLFIVDKVPRGVAGELGPALQSLRAAGRARCALGLRDILDEPDAVRREWAADANEDVVRRFYDVVWVYGDRAVHDVAREYALADDVADRIRYTGYLDRRPATAVSAQRIDDALAPLCLPPGRLALCMVGGGQDGAAVAAAFAAAPLPPGTNALVLTGPFMPGEARRDLQHAAARAERLRVLEFVTDTAPLLAVADRVVTMGGYNSVCEALSFGLRALVVPRVRPRREQLVRAETFARLGLLDVLHPDALSARAIGEWLARPLPAPRPAAPPAAALDFGGLDRLPDLVRELCARPPARSAPSGAGPAVELSIRVPEHPLPEADPDHVPHVVR